MTEFDPHHDVSRLLDELGAADPPPGFARSVMARIRDEQAASKKTIRFKREDRPMTRKVMWGLATAAAITLAVFAIKGFPPVGRGAEGTIGAAQKYQAPQIADKDVVLGDAAVQEFLQSDTFERVMNDVDARSLLADAGVRSALENAELRKALEDPEIRASLTSAELRKAFADVDLRQALASAELRKAFDVEMRKSGGDPSLRQAVNDAALRQAAADAALRKAVRDAGVRQAVGEGALRKAIE